MHLPRSPRRRSAAWAAAAITAAAVPTGPAPAFAQSDTAVTGTAARSSAAKNTTKVDPAVLDTVEKGEESTFFVVLKKQADLSAARGRRGHDAKATAAHEEFGRAAALAGELPYPAGAFTVDEAGRTDWSAARTGYPG
ncbi:hypothetical protein ACIQZB_29695 [Streptomyces sp. NPDC097727]|uniref:hypothetical protein n=1 Tax=Streptomyces sp. NPDC097727 TaxID=3366092 RepID=UPI0038204334